MFGNLQNLIILALSLAVLGGALWGLIEAVKFSPSAYVAAGKRSKALWVGLLAAAAIVSFISLPTPLGRGGGPINLFGIATMIVVVYFFADIRPKVSQHHGPRGSSGGGW